MASAAPCPSEQARARPSFAKVAAPTYKPQNPIEAAPPSVKSLAAIPQSSSHSSNPQPSAPTNGDSPAVRIAKSGDGAVKETAGNTATRTGQWAAGEQVVSQAESKEEEAEKPRPSIALVKFSTAEDSTTQLSSSNSSAKPASLDGKSVASVTTFALDEKESIRPDDSASLRAVEEEDVTSPPESNAAGSRVGSDSEARAFRAQLHEIAVMGPQPQRGVPPGRFPSHNPNGPPTLYDPNQPPNGIGGPMSQPLVNGVPPDAGPQAMPALPDEKLIEALQSPRDRLFVVKIEQDFIDFIKDSRENEYCLPNCNTFYRMLAHRLADYYLLGHVVDSTMTGVRITRTPYCRIPPPLSQMVDATKSANTPPVDLPARKIMRRGDETKSGTNTTANSESPSKATSEADGSDGDGGSKSKDKSAMTREEREARYREARQRIFGNAQSDENEAPELATSTEEKDPSRSSSTSGKKKMKKQRNLDDDDGFEARSRYNAYYPGQYPAPGYTGDGTVYYSGFSGPMPTQHFAPMQPNASPPPSYSNGYQAIMTQDAQSQYAWGQQYQPSNGPMMYPGYGAVQNGYDMSADFQRGMQSFQSAGMSNQMTPKMANASMAGYSDPYAQPPPNLAMSSGWPQQSAYPMSQGPYGPSPGSGNRPMSAPAQGPVPGTYPYGQFPPPSFNGKVNRNQHPIPGSYQRQQFNPQSQAFVPGGRNMPFQMSPNMGGGPQQMMAGYGGLPMPAASQMPHPMQLPSPSTANTQTFGSSHIMQGNNLMPVNPNSSPSSYPTPSSQGLSQHNTSVPAQSSIAKYGTPSNLPARPPPTQQQAPKFNLPGHAVAPGARVLSNPASPYMGSTTQTVPIQGGSSNN